MTRLVHVLVAVLVVVVALTGCSGSDCDELPALRAERDAAREAYVERARSGAASEDETARGDEAVHRLDRQVHELEQACG